MCESAPFFGIALMLAVLVLWIRSEYRNRVEAWVKEELTDGGWRTLNEIHELVGVAHPGVSPGDVAKALDRLDFWGYTRSSYLSRGHGKVRHVWSLKGA